ncbi:NAD(P)-binding protein [Lentinus tigrinus ALCF2SS1-7]|uniref:NAD(P)-binding protein n=1 Tax=Lentinus tigrinus ALCF2SS1-6 TaxID=1328759 RepID=A0A5C2S033_9APHY|nr:NAD(P)-binding protein [Lentinus tigrinus ALCF2SS1-6]RPD71637.1 NAD(P)-binding protein [Lentinus tigrinus ALCF2SS1-7]
MGGLVSKDSGIWPTIVQQFPSKSKFSVDQIPDLSGRVVIVTGGNSGIGYETVKVLLQRNAKVYLAARSRSKAEAAISSLKDITGKEATFLELDLASLRSVKNAAEKFLSNEHELHILFNNAYTTADGYDLQFGTNVIGHWYFTELLMPTLLEGVKTSPEHHARIVTTSSGGAYMSTLHWDTFKDGPARRKKTTEDLYYQSKFGNAVVAHQIAKRYSDRGIVSIAVNPGSIRTDLQRNVSKIGRAIMNATILYPTSCGALTQLLAGTMPEALSYNGEFLIPWARLGRCRPEAYDDAVGDRLWKWLEDETRDV